MHCCIYNTSKIEYLCCAAILFRVYGKDIQLIDSNKFDALENKDSSMYSTLYIVGCCSDFCDSFITANNVVCIDNIKEEQTCISVLWGLLQTNKDMPRGVELVHTHIIKNIATTSDTYIPSAHEYYLGLSGFRDVTPKSSIWEIVLHPNSSLHYIDIIRKGRVILNYIRNTYYV